MRACPHCDRMMPAEDNQCPHCFKWSRGASSRAKSAEQQKSDESETALQRIEVAFIKLLNVIKGYDNANDVLVHISDVDKGRARRKFSIDLDANIIFIRDTSFWNNRDQGYVISSFGIHYLPDNDSPNEVYFISWLDLKKVVHRDADLYLYIDDDTYLMVDPHDLFKKTAGEIKSTEYIKLAQAFMELAQAHQKAFEERERSDEELEIEELEQRFFEICKIDYDEAAPSTLQEIITTGHRLIELGAPHPTYPRTLARAYLALGELKLADSYADQAIKICINDEEVGANDKNVTEYLNRERAAALLVKTFCRQRENNNQSARQTFYEASSIDKGVAALPGGGNYEAALARVEEPFYAELLERPYQSRKLLCFVEQTPYSVAPQSFQVVESSKLPSIQLPIGHPIPEQLYVGHPLIPYKYIPYEMHELALLEDRLREFCYLMQCLGASEIAVCSNRSNRSQQETARVLEGEISTSTLRNKTHADFGMDSKESKLQEITSRMNFIQHYDAPSRIFLPEDLVWYGNEPSWQRLSKQRIQGGLLVHSEVISSSANRVISTNERNKIKAEFDTWIWKASGEGAMQMQLDASESETIELSIQVKFYPPNGEVRPTAPSISIEPERPSIPSSTLSDNEAKYRDEVLDILEELGEIDATARILLDRKAKHLGLSVEQARAIEAAAQQPQLSPEEEAYLEEVRFCLENDDMIDSTERRLLERKRQRLGISEARAQELEALIIPAQQWTQAEMDYRTCLEDLVLDGSIHEEDREYLERKMRALAIPEERAAMIERMVLEGSKAK